MPMTCHRCLLPVTDAYYLSQMPITHHGCLFAYVLCVMCLCPVEKVPRGACTGLCLTLHVAHQLPALDILLIIILITN